MVVLRLALWATRVTTYYIYYSLHLILPGAWGGEGAGLRRRASGGREFYIFFYFFIKKKKKKKIGLYVYNLQSFPF